MSLVVRDACVVTVRGGAVARRGEAHGALHVEPHADVLVEGQCVAAVGPGLVAPRGAEEIDARGRVLLPGFVDCHTHACWAGDRLDEWDAKLRGVPYLDLLRAGGGIHATVRAVRAASEEGLASALSARVARMLREGTTTVEVKSGYGLDADSELKMLRAIARVAKEGPGTVVPTALLGHAFEGDHDAWVRGVVDEALPRVSAEWPGLAVDAFCEQGAWSREACVSLFERARGRHPLRVHADQFHALGMVADAVRLGARSVDHLEASSDADLGALAASPTFGVVLPGTGFHGDGRYARAGALVALGGAVALATNCNPGSSPTSSMPFAIALAVRFCGLTPAQAIVAATHHGALVLGLPDRGRIEPGLRADLALLCHTDPRALAFEVGGNPVEVVVCGGRRLVP